MKLSILIPMFNAQAYIGNCLESLVQQNLSKDDYEILVMDDGSSDNSADLVKTYTSKYKNIRLYKEKNAGAYASRNKLLKLAKGEYIYNLDADDYLAHFCLKNILRIAEDHNLDIVGFKTIETPSLDKHDWQIPNDGGGVEVISGEELIAREINMRNEIWWYIVKRKLIADLSIVFSRNQYNADVLFTLNVFLQAKKVVFLPFQLHRYVQTEDSLMRSTNFDIVVKRVNYIQMMVLNFSKLITSLKERSDFKNEIVIKNLEFRRDVFAFFNLINMVRDKFSKADVQEKIGELKMVNAYPIKHLLGERYHSLTYKSLVFIINREFLFYPAISIKSLFFKGLLKKR